MKLFRYSTTPTETFLKYEYNKSISIPKIERKKAFNRCDSSHVIDSLFEKMFKVAKAKENKDLEIWKISESGEIIRKSEDTIVDKRSSQ